MPYGDSPPKLEEIIKFLPLAHIQTSEETLELLCRFMHEHVIFESEFLLRLFRDSCDKQLRQIANCREQVITNLQNKGFTEIDLTRE